MRAGMPAVQGESGIMNVGPHAKRGSVFFWTAGILARIIGLPDSKKEEDAGRDARGPRRVWNYERRTPCKARIGLFLDRGHPCPHHRIVGLEERGRCGQGFPRSKESLEL